MKVRVVEMPQEILSRLDISITSKPKFKYSNGFLEVSNLKIKKGFKYKTLVKKKIEAKKNRVYLICYDKGLWKMCEKENASGVCLYLVKIEQEIEQEGEKNEHKNKS